MPDKHIRLSESYLGLASFVLDSLTRPRTLDQVWVLFKKARKRNSYPASHGFENLILAFDILFAIGAIQEVPTKEGWYEKCA